MKHLYYFLAILLCVVLVSSCNKTKSLGIKGLWNEEVTAVYDTNNHNEIHALNLDCDGNFSFIRTMYYCHYQNPGNIQTDSILDSTVNNGAYVMRQYSEYVEGQYSTINDKIYFNGFYYINPEFTIVADSTNTQYSYGRYDDTVTFVIDSKCLMFNLDVSEDLDVRRFGQQTAYECTW
jgi:hypothetical protein